MQFIICTLYMDKVILPNQKFFIMKIDFKYGKDILSLEVPKDSIIYSSSYPKEYRTGSELLIKSLSDPISTKPLKDLLAQKRKGDIVIVVSDITRPIPYKTFLPALLKYLHEAGIPKNVIKILVATGMHRGSTLEEKIEMFGKEIVDKYCIIDHNAEDEKHLSTLTKKSWSGSTIKLNSLYVEAGFRIITGLVEPHFMAGFSGGRKSICPGLASLETIKKFHGYQFLNNPKAANAILVDNPCHLENTSIAHICPPDFGINIILNQNRELNKIISGDPFLSHEFAISYLKDKCCKIVTQPADLIITSCGGYPLDTTFYQCVKGFVNCLPALKNNASIIAFGSCTEGVGSIEYKSLMKQYSNKIDSFIDDIKHNRFFIKDQWQFQMHIRVIKKIGLQNLHFYTNGISEKELSYLSINKHFIKNKDLAIPIQEHIDNIVKLNKIIAVLPEGP